MSEVTGFFFPERHLGRKKNPNELTMGALKVETAKSIILGWVGLDRDSHV